MFDNFIYFSDWFVLLGSNLMSMVEYALVQLSAWWVCSHIFSTLYCTM